MILLELLTLLAPIACQDTPAQAAEAKAEPVVVGEGDWRYTWDDDWMKLPEGRPELGSTHGCIVVDSKDRVYVNTDTEAAIMVFDSAGNYLRSWGKQYAGGLHGMCIVEQGKQEFLYLTHLGRHEVLKTTLDGEVLWSRGVPMESGLYKDAGQYRPTSVAVRPDGGFYVADGYGLSWIHRYDAEGVYLSSFGGPGSKPGKLKTPHGIWWDERGEQSVLLVADRENHRLVHFDAEGKFLEVFTPDLRRPCHAQLLGETVVVADLAGRVTLLDGKNELLVHLGDQPDPKLRAQFAVPREKWKPGAFFSPHCAQFDSKGDLYVMDWNATGRLTKLVRIRD
jgi:hypothetical protein